MSHRRYPWRQGAISGAIAALAGLLLLVLPFTRVLTDLSYDLPFLFRGPSPVEGVAIVYMDEKSEERLQQRRWAPVGRRLRICAPKSLQSK